MSYILDALKKSEEERKKHQEHQDTLYPRLSDRTTPPRRNRMVPALIITSCMLLVIIIMGVGMWVLNRQDVQEPATASTVNQGANQVASVQTESAAQIAQTENQIIHNDEAITIDKQQVEQVKPAGSDEKPVTQNTAEQAVQKDHPAKADRLPFLSELPFSTRSMLPDMEYRGHVYSPTPDKRMIMINAVIVREGDIIAPDLSLTEITENGLIMDFRGTGFQLELFHAGSR